MYDIYIETQPEELARILKLVDVPSNYNNDEYIKELIKSGVDHLCYIKGRGLCGIQRMAFTTGLFYGFNNDMFFWQVGRYCYQTKAEAVDSLRTWNGIGDPEGDWIKQKGVSEYSNPKHKI